MKHLYSLTLIVSLVALVPNAQGPNAQGSNAQGPNAQGSNALQQLPESKQQVRAFFQDCGPTSKVSLAAEEAFWLRLPQLYRAHSRDDKAVHDRAIDFLRNSISIDYGQWELADLAIHKDKLFADGKQLIEAGSKDPLILCYFVDELLRRGRGTEARKIAKRAVAALEDSAYPLGIRTLALARFFRASRVVVGGRTIDKAREQLILSGADWFKWACESPNCQRPAWKYFDSLVDLKPIYNSSKSVQRARIDDLDQTAQAYQKTEDADPWIVEMLMGSFQNDLGWHFRGSGFADTVSKKNWRLFEQRQTLAGEHFTKAYKLAPDRPESSYEMIAVCRSSDQWGSEVDWFKRCVAAEVDFTPAFSRMLVYRSTRWLGSQDEMMEFAELCLASDRYETLVPYMYLRGLDTICRLEETTWEEILGSPGVFDRAQKLLTRLANHPSRCAEGGLTVSQVKLKTELLCLCLKVERYDLACQLFDELGEQVSASAMFNFSFFDHRFFRSRAFAYREFFKELDAYRRKSRFAHQTREHSKNYHDFYVELQGKSKELEAELFYQTLIDRTQMELDFHDGKWVNLTFDPGFSNWSANSVNWTYESPTSATASNQREWTQMQMYHFSDFPGPKEVMAEVELVAKGSGSIGVGLTIGPMNGVEGGRLFYIDPIKNKRGVTSNCERSDGAALKHWESESIVKSSKLHLKFWSPQQFAFYTDGYIFQIKSDSDFLQDGGDDRFKIGLGERQNRSDNGVVRFKSVRVRKLDIQPPPKGENERSLKYYQEAIEREPGYFSHHRMKGNACFALERYDEVEIAYRIASEMRPMDLLLAHDYGDCLTRLGKFQAALEQFSKVCKDDKAYYRSASTSIMAMIYASAPDDSLLDAERAISLAEDSMKLAGKNTSSINFLGLGLAQGANGDFDSAIKSLNESKEVAAEKYHVRLIESAISAFEKGKPFKLPVPE